MFLRYFEGQGHRRVRSSSLVPANDPTLLFTNAGMNQFKDVFLGLEQRDYKRATSSQKCVRAGGKHNDLENVGFTNRHHTFFEMLGNFSFGDYFKEDAIAFAFELITSPKWFGISLDKLYFTVFGGAEVTPGNPLGTDEEAAALWKAVGAPEKRVLAIPGLKENFWAMGDTGPCGPCSEIHYDMGPAASDVGHTDCTFPCDCGRYVEIWNLVFMQFNRYCSIEEPGRGGLDEGTPLYLAPEVAEGVRRLEANHRHGADCLRLNPLPKPSVDTGAGLERLAAALQGKISNYDTDLFMPLMQRAAELCSVDFDREEKLEEGRGGAASLRVIADHFRAASFLVADGVVPGNEGRGYVLRKILRRAFSHANYLNPQRFFVAAGMAEVVRKLYGKVYPELLADVRTTSNLLAIEEDRFLRITANGLRKLDETLVRRLDSKARSEMAATGAVRSTTPRLSGRDAFYLYDTFGLPRDFIEDATRDRNVTVDWQEFDQAMTEQRRRARASWKGGHKEIASPIYAKLAELYHTEPDFYFESRAKDCRIEAIVSKDGAVNEIAPGEEAEILLDRTAFYAESGGQVADIGALWNNEQTLELAEVRGAYYPVSGLIAHKIVAKENLRVGDRVACVADGPRREHIKRNHTATHLMHAALRNILGTHVKQAGSLVAPDRLRFDFSHFAAVDPAELRDIEDQVNDQIRRDAELTTDLLPLEDALASGALAFFGDRYPEQNVRVVTIPDADSPRGFYSKELCGGTHVRRSGEVGIFKISVEQASSAGVRRIEAITGGAALADYQRAKEILAQLSGRLGVAEENLVAALERGEQSQRQLEKQLETLKRKSAQSMLDELVGQARDVKGIKVISAELENVDRETLRQLADGLRQRLGSGVVVLGTAEDGKVALLAGVTKDLIPKLHAGKIVQELAKHVGGSGGGRPDLAEAGGKDTSALKKALLQVYPLIERML
ncbi:MAG: alanine--tRNA ligase [Candidatus Acidiferrales bacterium]